MSPGFGSGRPGLRKTLCKYIWDDFRSYVMEPRVETSEQTAGTHLQRLLDSTSDLSGPTSRDIADTILLQYLFKEVSTPPK